MAKNPFATVITVQDNQPSISHLPLTPKKNGNELELIGHMAKANPQWKYLENNLVTCIFHGAHTYITPVWYTKDDVPTWNYSTVHAKGNATLIETEPELILCLKELTDHAEKYQPSG